MAVDNIDNYKNLAYAILMQQCIDYERAYRSYLRFKSKHKEDRLKYLREELIHHSWAKFLPIDMEAAVEDI